MTESTTRRSLRAERDGRASAVAVAVDATRRTRRRRLWIWCGAIALMLIAGALAAGFAAQRVYANAQSARSSLLSAMVDARTMKSAVAAGDIKGATVASERLAGHMDAASRSTSGRLWSFAESLPLPGAGNLTAVRVLSHAGSELATQVSGTVKSVDFSSLQPHGGAWDLAAMARISAGLNHIDKSVVAASRQVDAVPRKDLLPEVDKGIEMFGGQLHSAHSALGPLSDTLGLLPNALGANGPRTYLLMFQGNSEARSLGGNAAIFVLLRAEGGRVSIVREATGKDFPQPLRAPVISLDPQAVNIYGDKIGRYTPDFTMIPDFPQAVAIAKGWWTSKFGTGFDAALSVDPVALSYVLRATGSIALPTGDTLTADNAAPLLLNEAYFRYADTNGQDAFFAMAADSVFAALTRGGIDTAQLMAALSKGAAEGRILYSSADPAEEAVIAGTRISGSMPTDNTKNTAVGVYLNDDTGSKKSYYLDMGVNVCAAGPSVEVRAQLASDLTEAESERLPRYVSGPYFALPDISSYVVLYGPVGTTLKGITVDGQPAAISSAGIHLGRPAVKVHIMSHQVSTHTIVAHFEGLNGQHGPLQVWTTPMSRATPVVVAPACTG